MIGTAATADLFDCWQKTRIGTATIDCASSGESHEWSKIICIRRNSVRRFDVGELRWPMF
jgi:hypothetical protein